MSGPHPHLIVLGGPDGGRTIVLDHLPVTIGRAGQCQIHLAEEFISREHLRLAAGDEGVVLEILSVAGVCIEGRKFRKGQHILLGTGDVFTLGAETDILFVAAEDDRKAVLADVQAARAAAAAARQAEAPQPQPQEATEPVDRVEPEPAEGESPGALEAEPESLTPAQVAEQQRAQRRRKILIALGVYLALMAVGAILLSIWSSNTKRDDAGAAKIQVLTSEQIMQILKRPPVNLSANSQEAERAAADARQLFASRHINPGDAYRCIRQYLRYKAFANRLRFEVAADQDKFGKTLAELMDRLWPTYHRACLEVRQQRWHAAKKSFEQVQQWVPLENDPINRNVQRHLKHVYDRIRKSKRKPRRGPLG